MHGSCCGWVATACALERRGTCDTQMNFCVLGRHRTLPPSIARARTDLGSTAWARRNPSLIVVWHAAHCSFEPRPKVISSAPSFRSQSNSIFLTWGSDDKKYPSSTDASKRLIVLLQGIMSPPAPDMSPPPLDWGCLRLPVFDGNVPPAEKEPSLHVNHQATPSPLQSDVCVHGGLMFAWRSRTSSPRSISSATSRPAVSERASIGFDDTPSPPGEHKRHLALPMLPEEIDCNRSDAPTDPAGLLELLQHGYWRRELRASKSRPRAQRGEFRPDSACSADAGVSGKA